MFRAPMLHPDARILRLSGLVGGQIDKFICSPYDISRVNIHNLWVNLRQQ
jgi:hypothetical protein